MTVFFSLSPSSFEQSAAPDGVAARPSGRNSTAAMAVSGAPDFLRDSTTPPILRWTKSQLLISFLPGQGHLLRYLLARRAPRGCAPATRLFLAIAIRINNADRQIVVRFRQLPTAVLSALEGLVIRENQFGNLGTMCGGGLVLVRNHNAIFPAS